MTFSHEYSNGTRTTSENLDFDKGELLISLTLLRDSSNRILPITVLRCACIYSIKSFTFVTLKRAKEVCVCVCFLQDNSHWNCYEKLALNIFSLLFFKNCNWKKSPQGPDDSKHFSASYSKKVFTSSSTHKNARVVLHYLPKQCFFM